VDAVVSSPGQPIDGLSALLVATRQGHLDVVAQLLEGGASVSKTMADGTGAVHFAVQQGHAEIISLLADAGADLNARKDRHKQATPLLSAAQMNSPSAVEALIDGGADLSRQVYTPNGDVVTTLRFCFDVAVKTSRRGGPNAAKAEGVKEVLQRASRRPVLAAYRRLALAKLASRRLGDCAPCRWHLLRGRGMQKVLRKTLDRVSQRMAMPTCAMTVRATAVRSFARCLEGRAHCCCCSLGPNLRFSFSRATMPMSGATSTFVSAFGSLAAA